MAEYSIRFGMRDGKTETMKTRACIVVSSPMTIQAFLQDQLRAMSALYEMSVVANAPDEAFLKRLNIRARFMGVAVERKVCLLGDLQALNGLLLFFLRERFQIVHSITSQGRTPWYGSRVFCARPCAGAYIYRPSVGDQVGGSPCGASLSR